MPQSVKSDVQHFVFGFNMDKLIKFFIKIDAQLLFRDDTVDGT